MKIKNKDIWHQLEVKTGKQKTLWVLTIISSAVFGNNVADLLRNITQEPLLFGTLYISSFFLLRIILGKLFD